MAQLLKPGQKIADYEVMELVGQGGMGEVYRARQVSMDRVVALKTLAPRLAKKDPTFAKRFVEEARAAGRLNHANIVAVHDVDQTQIETAEGLHAVDFFSMEFVDGESVKDVIERDGACKLPLVERVMLGMAEALIYAESQKVIHRDIKPDNIMITVDGVIKLADLGLAVQAGADSVADQRDEHGRAKVMGTPLYMSPEQARALPLDPRSDQYSLGATLFHMLTGQPPYRGEDPRSVMRAHVFNAVPDPGALRPELPEGWCRLCRRLMAKKPEERFLNARELKFAIDSVIAGHDSDVDSRPRPAVRPISERPLALAGMIGGGVLAVVLLVVWVMSPAAKTPVQAPVAPVVDPVIETERRVKDAIARLPEDAGSALLILDRLATDPANRSALTYIEQARAPRRTAVEADKRKAAEDRLRRVNGKLDEVQKLVDAGQVVQAWQVLPDTDAMPNEALARRATLVKRLGDLVTARCAAIRKRMAETDADGIEALAGDIATLDLEARDKERLRTEIEARRSQLKADDAQRQKSEEQTAWRTLAELIDQQRGRHYDLATIATASQSRFSTPASLALVKALIEAQPTMQRINHLLIAHIDSAKPEVPIIIDGQADQVRLVKVDDATVTIQPAKGRAGSEQVIDRRQAFLPWGELVGKAMAKYPPSSVAERQGLAAYLWMCRAPEAQAARELLGDDPLAKVLTLLDALVPRLALIAPVQRDERRITVKYLFGPQSRLLHGDFLATGLTQVDAGMCWTATGGQMGKVRAIPDDRQVPTLRWQGRLRAPLEWSGRLILPGDAAMVLVGFDTGTERIRVALQPRPAAARLGLVGTGKDGTITRLGATTPWFLRIGGQVQVKLTVDAKGQFAVVVDEGKPITAPGAALPVGAELTPIIQVVQAPEARAAITLSELSFSGEMPGEALMTILPCGVPAVRA